MRRRIVVAGVVVDGDRVLVARRARPRAETGRWEFPGGKVEPGESAAQALERELHEELGITVAVGPELGRAPLTPDVQLVAHTCRSVGAAPAAGRDHDEVRWLSASELAGLDWLAADRQLLSAVTAYLLRSPDFDQPKRPLT